jgi:hypothetical protein
LSNERGKPTVVTNEPVELEKELVQVQDFRGITHDFRGIHELYLKVVKKNGKITAYVWEEPAAGYR